MGGVAAAAAAAAATARSAPPTGVMLRRLGMRALDATEIVVARLAGRTAAVAASPFLSGGFTPTAATPQRLPVTVDDGAIPVDIAGTFARVGPNPHPRNAPVSGFHWFDGDGYVHAVALRRGGGSYSGQWVVTAQLVAEVRAGFPRYGRLGGMYGLVGVAEGPPL